MNLDMFSSLDDTRLELTLNALPGFGETPTLELRGKEVCFSTVGLYESETDSFMFRFSKPPPVGLYDLVVLGDAGYVLAFARAVIQSALDPEPSPQSSCDCGALKTKTTHSTWCSTQT